MKEREVRKIMEGFVRDVEADTLHIDMGDGDDVAHAEILKLKEVLWRYPKGSKRVIPASQEDPARGFSIVKKDYDVGSMEKDMVV